MENSIDVQTFSISLEFGTFITEATEDPSMTPNVGSATRSADDREVVAAIDEIDGRRQLVIADLTRDDEWLSMSESSAVTLEDCR